MSTNTKKIMIYQSSINLPREGWLQRCFICNQVTGNTMSVVKIYVFKQDIYLDYSAYICIKCENKVMSRVHCIDETIYRIKHKFFKMLNKSIIDDLHQFGIYNYSIENVANTNYNHTQLTSYLRKYTYFPVEPNPPDPLDVSSNSSTNSTRENGDKSGVQT